MRLSAFDYELPEAAIALRPARPRGGARLMVMRPGEAPADRLVGDVPTLLRAGDLLVVNDTAVVPAQLAGVRRRGEGAPLPVAVTLHRREAPDRWRAFAKPGRRLAPGDRLELGTDGGLGAEVLERGADVLLAFDRAGAALDDAVAARGAPPLPPYIAARRPADEHDREDYQTVFARAPGAVAAPTAGLHFTDELLASLGSMGVGMARVTLHVGAGTFLPVTADHLADHVMHAEWGEVGEGAAAAVAATRASGGRVVAVGTTSLRLLETAAAAGGGAVVPWRGETDVFLRPGHRFAGADLLLTNFHLPRSTLLVLVAAFHGRRAVLDAYARALREGYRFASYGDACLMHPDPAAWERPT